MTTEIFQIEQGAFITVPHYIDDRRAKNWAAVIAEDPTAPGGLKRTWLTRAKGRFIYQAGGLRVGMPVEFGADYKSQRNRWYGFVVKVTETAIEFQSLPTARQAIQEALEFVHTTGVPSPEILKAARKLSEIREDIRRRAGEHLSRLKTVLDPVELQQDLMILLEDMLICLKRSEQP